jgi:hypothetical protein
MPTKAPDPVELARKRLCFARKRADVPFPERFGIFGKRSLRFWYYLRLMRPGLLFSNITGRKSWLMLWQRKALCVK